MLRLAFASLAAAGAVEVAAKCEVTPVVDRHMLRPAMDASLRPTLGWTLSPGCGAAPQTGFVTALFDRSGKRIWSSTLVQTNRSDSIPFVGEGSLSLNPDGWMRGASFDYRALSAGSSFAVSVGVTLEGNSAVWSDPMPFHTQLQPSQYMQSAPMWAPNRSAEFVMLRREVHELAMPWQQQVFLGISAKPSPDWHYPHSRNTSHLLCAYKLWVNGVPLGAGPGRVVGNAIEHNYSGGGYQLLRPPIPIDTYNLTSLAKAGKGVTIAIEAYYRSCSAVSGQNCSLVDADDDRGGVVTVLHDGDGKVLDGGAESWKAFDATAAFNPHFGKSGIGAGGGPYSQPHEDIDLRLYPHGWRSDGFDDESDGWSAAEARPAFAVASLAAKEALPVSLRNFPAASFEILSKTTDAMTGGDSYHYIIDYGKNFQGHVNISFASGTAGQQVNVSLGEQRTATAVVSHAESRNVWIDTWTLAGSGADSFVPHEYSEFRWAEVVGAPEPPTHDTVSGWMVHYPFDGKVEPPTDDASERGEDFSLLSDFAGLTTGSKGGGATPPGLTSFSSNVAELDDVFELVSHTINAAALDLNSDSNTRQRDLCTLDAWVATRYQGGVSPGTSSHLRRRVTQSMYEPNGFVNWWTEFLIAHVGALYDYTFEYADQSLAGELWNKAPVPMMENKIALGMDNYSLLAYFNASDNLVHKTPKPLVDWPRSDGIDTSRGASSVCDNLCVQMNSYAVLAQGWLAEISKRSGIAGKQASGAFSKRSADIKMAAQSLFALSGSKCDPTGSPDGGGPDSDGSENVAAEKLSAPLECYADQPPPGSANNPESQAIFTSATATSVAAFAQLPDNPSGVLALVPFLKARNGRRGPRHGMETSAWMTGFMLEGIYTAAGDVTEPKPDDTTATTYSASSNAASVEATWAAVLAAADFAHDTLTNEGNNSWLGMIRQNGEYCGVATCCVCSPKSFVCLLSTYLTQHLT